jgi:hypothetical protein
MGFSILFAVRVYATTPEASSLDIIIFPREASTLPDS